MSVHVPVPVCVCACACVVCVCVCACVSICLAYYRVLAMYAPKCPIQWPVPPLP